MKLNRITVFCGSSYGTEAIYEETAIELGKILATENIGLVYGGANVGLMGSIADSVIKNNGTVIGVLPHFLKRKEIAHQHLSELILVDTMHQRKTKMNELSDGVIALPGGFGTLEELFEMLTWAQLGLHQKPVALLNIDGFYNELLSFLKTMIEKGFLKQIYFDMIIVDNDISSLLKKMKNFKAPIVEKWITKEQV